MRTIWTHNEDCPKCGGEGWLWWFDLMEYSGPANETGQDDTQYACDHECHGKEIPDGVLVTTGKETAV